MKKILTLTCCLVGLVASGACTKKVAETTPHAAPTAAATKTLQGVVRVDGSSTVYPITEAVAEEFGKLNPKVRVTVGVSGTGGGFKKFGAGEIDIADASRPIKASEADAATQQGIEYIELPVAYDGLSVVVHPQNAFVSTLSIAELKRIWEPGSTVTTWADVRSEWPARAIHLYGPGPDSGTFDYFTGAVVGTERASRSDYSASEDDNVLIQGVSGDLDALGYFGYAYFYENQQALKAVPIDGGHGAIAPNPTTIENGTYPLSRPIMIYVSTKAMARPEVDAFVDFYLEQAGILVSQVGYVPLPKSVYALTQRRFDQRTLGSVLQGATHGAALEALLR